MFGMGNTVQGSADMTAIVSGGRSQTTTWTGYAASAWTLVFIAFHIYWFMGGHLGIGDAPNAIPGTPKSVIGWIINIIVNAMFAAGVVVPIALVRPWGRNVSHWILLTLMWLGSSVLAARGVAGILDSLLRVTHVLRNGLTGLTYQQTLGQAHPSAYTLWSFTAIDTYFLIGGILFGVAAWMLKSTSER
jgi:hypothetical protein